MAKRNKQIDAEVIACASAGMSVRAIAEKYTLSKSTILKILSEGKNGQKVSFVIRFKAVLKNYKHENNTTVNI